MKKTFLLFSLFVVSFANSQGVFVGNESQLTSAVTSQQSHIIILNDFDITTEVELNYPVLIEGEGIKKKISSSSSVNNTRYFFIKNDNVTLQNLYFESTNSTNTAIEIQSGNNDITLKELKFSGFKQAIYKTGSTSSTYTNGLLLSDLEIINSSPLQTDHGAISINHNLTDLIVENIIIKGSTGEGLELLNHIQATISNIRITDTDGIGMELFNAQSTLSDYEVNNVSVQDCDGWGISFHNVSVVASNLKIVNTRSFGLEIVGQDPTYDYSPVQVSNLIISYVRKGNSPKGIGISIDGHAMSNISNFHIEGPPDENDFVGIQAINSKHFSIHDGLFRNMFRGVDILSNCKSGSVYNNFYSNINNNLFLNVNAAPDIFDINNTIWHH